MIMVQEYKELRLFSKSEAAKALSIGKDALGLLIATGKIGVIPIGDRHVISYREIQRYIEENTIKVDELGSDKVNLESFRETTNQKPSINTLNLLNRIMENENGKYIS